MIQYIGLMIGFYIIVRMIQIFTQDKDNTVTKVFAAITLILTLFFMIGIIVSGVSSMPGKF